MKKIIAAAAVVVLVIGMIVCYNVFKPKPSADSGNSSAAAATTTAAQEETSAEETPAAESEAPKEESAPAEDGPVGEGAKTVSVEVTGQSGETVAYEIKTDADYLKGVMEELRELTDFDFSGSDSDFGLYIESINGETADYSVDGSYWSIYVNGEYGMYGADSQVVNDGDKFGFVREGAATETASDAA